MPKERGQRKAVLSIQARRDLREILIWSQAKFGRDAALRYEDLIVQALRDIEADMERPGSQDKSDLQEGIRSYHLSFSRERARTALGIVQNPRHFVIYRRRDGQSAIDILRITMDVTFSAILLKDNRPALTWAIPCSSALARSYPRLISKTDLPSITRDSKIPAYGPIRMLTSLAAR